MKARLIFLLPLALAACAIGTASQQAHPAGDGPASVTTASGELSGISGGRLILTTRGGTVTVLHDRTTAFERSVPGTADDIRQNVCVTATGPLEKTGSVSVRSLVVQPGDHGSCRPGPVAGSRVKPSPGSGRLPVGFTSVSGHVRGVVGATVTVAVAPGKSETLNLVPMSRVSRIELVPVSSLRTGQCMVATGTGTSEGIRATRVTVSEPTASGCLGSGRGPDASPRPASPTPPRASP